MSWIIFSTLGHVDIVLAPGCHLHRCQTISSVQSRQAEKSRSEWLKYSVSQLRLNDNSSSVLTMFSDVFANILGCKPDMERGEFTEEVKEFWAFETVSARAIQTSTSNSVTKYDQTLCLSNLLDHTTISMWSKFHHLMITPTKFIAVKINTRVLQWAAPQGLIANLCLAVYPSVPHLSYI